MMKSRLNILFFLLLFISSLSAEIKTDIVKSLIVPGWGQMKYNSKHSKILLSTELSLLTSFVGVSWYASVQHQDLKAYAAQYSNADERFDDERYWVDLGNYMSWEEHREEMLELRLSDNIYEEKFAWTWLDVDRANTYRNLRRDRDISRNRKTMIVGAMVFNRVISLVDLIYLNNISEKITLSYFEQSGVEGLNFSFILSK
ncbi:MAG: hypothetical protein KAI81_00660 [Candidatus Marinimicrobia bacterium]|nr:hypothetical protein [Candidatus Neomarinimicrobiota bacterium]